jgi:hypothetical protein
MELSFSPTQSAVSPFDGSERLRIGIGRILHKDKRVDVETFVRADGKAVILKRVK